MSEWIRIRVKDFYTDAIGETEYTYVTKEVYEALTETFRKEAHAQEMRDLRHVTKEGYTEGETEDLAFDSGESLEDMVIRQMELETLQKAMQSLTEVQRERLHLYFFEGLTYRQIAEKKRIGEKNVRESITGAIKKIKKFFDQYPPQIVILCEYLMRGVFRADGLSRKSSRGTLTNAGEDTFNLFPRAAQDHDVFCQPYPAVQIRQPFKEP